MPGKEFRYRVEIDGAGRARADGRAPVERDETWTPEHLVLIGLVRCTIASLEFHAARQNVTVTAQAATANGRIARRESDERFAFVEVESTFDVSLEPSPDDVEGLIALAERDCFVGASLTVEPSYSWRVNGYSY